MRNNETNKSKGYGFIEFNDYIEFKHALDNTEPVIFGKQRLIFNSARNKYDNFNYLFNMPKLINSNVNNPIYNRYNHHNTYNFYNSNKENLDINYKINNRPYKERENKFEIYKSINPEIKEENDVKKYSLNDQIKYSLQKIAKNYSKNDNFFKSKMCTYYCGPFLDKKIFDINKNSFNEK